MAQERVDIEQRARSRSYKLEEHVEDAEERASRLKRLEATEEHERWKDRITFITVLCSVVVIGAVCLWVSVDGRFSAEQQRWSTSLLTSLITGFLGYLTGKASRPS